MTADPTPRSASGLPRRAGMSLGKWLGVPVVLDVTWLLLAGYVTLSFASTEAAPLHSPLVRYGAGVITSVLLAGSVLLHELGHAVAAQALGLPVRRITLYLLGGISEIDRESPTADQEFLIALAGPVVSVVLAATGEVATLLLGPGVTRDVVQFVTVLNALLAVFNLLPGLPLDGGRLLRAAVWHVRRDPFLGTTAAATTGRVLAGLLIAAPAVVLVAGRRVSLESIVPMLVGFFIATSAGQALVRARLQRALPSITARGYARPLTFAPVGAPVAELVRRAQLLGAAAVALVDSRGQVVALVDEQQIAVMPEQRRPWVTADQVSVRLERWHLIDGGLAGDALIEHLRATGAAFYLVMEGPAPRGMLVSREVSAALQRAAR